MLGDLFSCLDYYGSHSMDWSVWLVSPVAGVIAIHYSTYWVRANGFWAVVNGVGHQVSGKFNEDKVSNVLMSIGGAFMAYMSLWLGIGLLSFMGLLPYSFNLLTHISTCLSVSIPLWGVMVVSSLILSAYQFVGKLVVSGSGWAQAMVSVNLEAVSVALRPFTLGLRLCLNITAGQLLLGFISGFYYSFLLPIFGVKGVAWCLFNLLFTFVEFGVMAYQCMLMLYLSGAYWDEHTLIS